MIPKLLSGSELAIGVDFTVNVAAPMANNLEAELRQLLAELGLGDRVGVERS